MSRMDFTDYQRNTNRTAIYKDSIKNLIWNDTEEMHKNKRIENSLKLSYIGLGLGEVGEIQNKLKKIIRDKGGVIDEETKKDLLKEAGDVLYYLAQFVEFLDGDFEQVAKDNLEKLFSRLERGQINGSGDNR